MLFWNCDHRHFTFPDKLADLAGVAALPHIPVRLSQAHPRFSAPGPGPCVPSRLNGLQREMGRILICNVPFVFPSRMRPDTVTRTVTMGRRAQGKPAVRRGANPRAQRSRLRAHAGHNETLQTGIFDNSAPWVFFVISRTEKAIHFSA